MNNVEIGHNGGPDIDEEFIIDNDIGGLIKDSLSIQEWVDRHVNFILMPNETRPKYFLKESVTGKREEDIVYVNFGPKEAKLRRNTNDEVTLVEWLSSSGHKIQKEAA